MTSQRESVQGFDPMQSIDLNPLEKHMYSEFGGWISIPSPRVTGKISGNFEMGYYETIFLFLCKYLCTFLLS